MDYQMKTLLAAGFLLLASSALAQGPASSYLPPGGEEGGKPEPYSFSYEVKDDASGNDYSHKADSDGKKVTGEYQVLLPDGRRQKVSYTADDGGYNADVQYEGEAKVPSGNGGGGGSGGYPSGLNHHDRRSPSSSGPAAKPGGSYLPPGK